MEQNRKLVIGAAAVIALLLIGQAATLALVIEQRAYIAQLPTEMPSGEPDWALALKGDVEQAVSNARDAERAADRAASLAEVVCREVKGSLYC